jgi:hypothetical protein
LAITLSLCASASRSANSSAFLAGVISGVWNRRRLRRGTLSKTPGPKVCSATVRTACKSMPISRNAAASSSKSSMFAAASRARTSSTVSP